MYSQIYSIDNELKKQRLAKLKEVLSATKVTTREDFYAALYSEMNSVLALGTKVSPIKEVQGETPAYCNTIQSLLSVLNEDANAIAKQISNLETECGQLFNLYAATQNGVRQSIRETIYKPSKNKYIESFITDDKILNHTGTIDFSSGAFYLPIVSTQNIKPVGVLVGDTSVLSKDHINDPAPTDQQLLTLLDAKAETSFTWNGPKLELVFTFDKIVILNRLRIELDQYQGLVIEELLSSPDGVSKDNLFSIVGDSKRGIDVFTGKFSGDYTLDFIPKHVKQIKLIITDKLGEDKISLRNITFYGIKYNTSAVLTTKKITGITGTVKVTSRDIACTDLTYITHQISYDGVGFTAINTNTELEILSSPFWYRVYLERVDSNFTELSKPVIGGNDPDNSTNFTLNDSTALDLGSGILERILSITVNAVADTSIPRVVQLRENPFPTTFSVWQNNVLLDRDKYSVSADYKTITFTGIEELVGISIKYQTSLYENQSLIERKEYYTPYVEEIVFEK